VHKSRTDQLKLADFLRRVGATSVRASCRQVIDLPAIVIANALRPDNGRSDGQEISCSQTCHSFNDLPRLWFSAGPQAAKGAVTLFAMPLLQITSDTVRTEKMGKKW
jgi:hypothetical protein